MAHPLLGHLLAAADGHHPSVDGGVTFLPGLDNGTSAVVALTGHSYIATDRVPTELGEVDGFGGSLAPATLLALAGGRTIGTHDALLVVRGS